MKKFELTTDFITFCGIKLFRIRALIEFGNVKAGDLGGYVEKEENLSKTDNAWIFGNAKVSGKAKVLGDAEVLGDAWIFGNAKVSGKAKVFGDAKVSGKAKVFGDAEVSGNVKVSGKAKVFGDAKVLGDAEVLGDAWILGDADYTTISGFGREYRTTTFFREKDRIAVKCGCFYGGLDEFRKKVKETHKDSKKGKEYLMIANLMEYHFKKGRC